LIQILQGLRKSAFKNVMHHLLYVVVKGLEADFNKTISQVWEEILNCTD